MERKKKKRIIFIFASIVALFLLDFIISALDVTLELRPAIEVEKSWISSEKQLPFPDDLYGIHMTNSPKKLKKNFQKYKNFELDAFYIDGDFYIAHDEEDISSITLADMLSTEDLSEAFVWLDYKNREHKGAEVAKRLSEILAEKGFDRERIIVEGGARVIKDFSDEGFFTAYTPPFKKKMTEKERKEIIKNTEKIIAETGVSALEGNVSQYPMLRDYFPDMEKVIHFARPYVPARKHMFAKRIIRDPKVKFFIAEDN